MVVELDIRVLVFACALAALVQGALSLLFASYHTNTPALRYVGYSSLATAGALFAAALQEILPNYVTLVLGRSLLGLAILLVDRAVRVFQGEPTRDPLGWIVTGGTAVVLGLLNGTTDDLRLWTGCLSISGLILLTRVALRLQRGARRDGTPAHRITAIIYWIFAATMLVRLVAVAVSPPHRLHASPDPLQLTTLPIAILLLSASTLGFWSMEVQRLHRELTKLASTDELTGTLNRRAFLAQCERHLARHSRSREQFSLVLFDLDHFKNINDTYGHPAGDEILRQAVRVLELAVRPGDVVGRFGGEEFAVLLSSVGPEHAQVAAERTLRAMAIAPLAAGEFQISVTCSAGVAAWPLHGGDLSELLHAADGALYAAKAGGRNCVRVAGAPNPLPEPREPAPQPALSEGRTAVRATLVR